MKKDTCTTFVNGLNTIHKEGIIIARKVEMPKVFPSRNPLQSIP